MSRASHAGARRPYPSTKPELTTMKHETVRTTAFAMPLTNPAFPPGPSPAQLGVTVAFLCSAAADQITGTAIAVDGG